MGLVPLQRVSVAQCDQRQLDGANPISNRAASGCSKGVRKANPEQDGRVGKLYEDKMEGNNPNG